MHIAVFLWGFTAILGKLISYGSVNLVWHRMLLAALIYLLIPATWRALRKMPLRQMGIYAGIGVLVCLHWLTFYGSIKLANSASLTLACLGTASFFSAVFETVVQKMPFNKENILLGILVLLGIAFISLGGDKTELGMQKGYVAAVITGCLSSALAALFTNLNKKYMRPTDALALSTIEMGSGFIFLSLCMPFISFLMPGEFHWLPPYDPAAGNYDLLWILLLVVVCTNFTFFLGTVALNHISAFTANLTVNLEPIYGIILGIVIFKENNDLNVWFYTGAFLVLISVFAKPLLNYKRAKNI